MPNTNVLEQARRTILTERDALSRLAERIGEEFVVACELLLGMPGRAIVSGIGKSGAVARKLASTLASTGTPAVFMHPAEAVHGDLGMVTDQDVVVFLSNSGETEEILNILPAVRRCGARIISICGAADSRLLQRAWTQGRRDRIGPRARDAAARASLGRRGPGRGRSRGRGPYRLRRRGQAFLTPASGKPQPGRLETDSAHAGNATDPFRRTDTLHLTGRPHMSGDQWQIVIVSRTIGADRGRAARGRPGV